MANNRQLGWMAQTKSAGDEMPLEAQLNYAAMRIATMVQPLFQELNDKLLLEGGINKIMLNR